MPESERDKGENPIVDSLAMASDWTVVSKCALHGLIYIWDLKGTIKNTNFKDAKENQVIEKEVTLLAQLKWSDTDNFYMHESWLLQRKKNGTCYYVSFRA